MFRNPSRLVFLCCLGLCALCQEQQKPQPLVFASEKECGSPLVESSFWFQIEGKVETVVSCDSLLLRAKDSGKLFRVRLAALKTPFRLSKAWGRAKRELEQRVLEKEVSVWVAMPSGMDLKPEQIGVVHLGLNDINFEMIQLGICKYHQAPPYSMSNYAECTYRQAERAAILAKRGVWSD